MYFCWACLSLCLLYVHVQTYSIIFPLLVDKLSVDVYSKSINLAMASQTPTHDVLKQPVHASTWFPQQLKWQAVSIQLKL